MKTKTVKIIILALMIMSSNVVFAQTSGRRIVKHPNRVQKKVQQKENKIQEKKNSQVERDDRQLSIVANLIKNMVYVTGGTFTMGDTSEQEFSLAKPAHSVTVSSFYIGKYEVTQEEWMAVMGNNPSYFKGNKLPVEQVSWDDCQEFIIRLNRMTGRNFRLPTEAEWEYAARGGSRSIGYEYAGSNNINEVAWNEYNSSNTTHEVGYKYPNELGLYDMSGNVSEWCQDWYGEYSSSHQINPVGSSSGISRITRGGSYSTRIGVCRVRNRGFWNTEDRRNDFGLRIVQ